MKSTTHLARLGILGVALCPLLLAADDSAPPKTETAVNADNVLRQMSDKLAAANKFSFTARRRIDHDLSGGDGLHGSTKIVVIVQRPDKMAATASLPHDTRRFYFDGKQLTLVDVQKKVYSTVPMAVSLDKLPSELAAIYGFTPPVAEFIISDLYQDLKWRAASIEDRGVGVIHEGFLGLKRVRCHRVGLTGAHADSELWIGVEDLLPRRWVSTLKRDTGNVEIRIELSKWKLEAKTRGDEFVYSPGKDVIRIQMVSEAEMAASRKAIK